MAANAGARQAGGQGMNEHVEFSVKAEEDLYLTGTENTIRRVTAETNYSCLMLKTQRFSSLFRHYAKYHGLRKDDLEYYFVNLLENEDTPESVQLQRGDTIMVRKRRQAPIPEAAADDDEFIKDMRDLLEDDEHMNATFLIPLTSHSATTKTAAASSAKGKDIYASSNVIRVAAHKSILTARTDYFKALFRTSSDGKGGGFMESEECVIRVEPGFTEGHVRHVLEFIYTNRIQNLSKISTDDLLQLLHLSDKWLLRELKRLVEHDLIRNRMSLDNVARLYGATEDFHAQRLAKACIEYIMANLRVLAGNAVFEEEMKNYPQLCIPVLKAAADLIPQQPATKKQRVDATPSSNVGSSPVPDNDT